MGLFMTLNLVFGQSSPILEENNRVLVLSDLIQMDSYSPSGALDKRKIQNDSLDSRSTFPRIIEIDPEFNEKFFEVNDFDRYPMPIKKLNGNHTMRIYVPDSTVNYTIRIKELGERFEGNEK